MHRRSLFRSTPRVLPEITGSTLGIVILFEEMASIHHRLDGNDTVCCLALEV